MMKLMFQLIVPVLNCVIISLEVFTLFYSPLSCIKYVTVFFFRQLHLHSGSDAVLNVTFLRAPSHASLKVDVPIVFLGEDVCPGLRKGMPYRCLT